MIIREEDPTTPDTAALIADHLAEMHRVSGEEFSFAFTVDKLRQPHIRFWVVREDGTEALMGCGALLELSADHAEVKSMRTHPDHLRKGVAAAVLTHILEDAAQRGVTRVSLETGAEPFFAPAKALYERFGFQECGPFADYEPIPNSVFMTRAIGSASGKARVFAPSRSDTSSRETSS